MGFEVFCRGDLRVAIELTWNTGKIIDRSFEIVKINFCMTNPPKIKIKSQKKESQGPESVFADIIDKMATPGSYRLDQLPYHLRNRRWPEKKAHTSKPQKALQPSR